MKTQAKLEYKIPNIFIVSSGRSGTSLLTSILNASQQINIPYESDFIARAYPFYKHKTNFNHKDYQQIFKLFKETSQPKGWGMSEEYLLSILDKKNPQTFTQVFGTFCDAYHQSVGAENLLWGIKAPVLIASIDRIIKVNENAKIVHIVRDGRDVYLSYKNVHDKSKIKFGPRGLVSNALYWIDGLRRIEEFGKNYSNIYEFSYEDMLNNPQEEFKQLCDFIGIEYIPEMHENYFKSQTNKELVSPELMNSIHTKLKGGLDPKNTKKYLTKMSKSELFWYEIIAYPYLKKYGYEIHTSSFYSMLFYPLRLIIYFLARLFNDLRYSKRDRIFYKQSLALMSENMNESH